MSSSRRTVTKRRGEQSEARLYFAAKLAWVEGATFRRNVIVTVKDGIIEAIDDAGELSIPRVAENVCDCDILLPGFINAHTHLEFCYCKSRLPRGNVPFSHWIEAIGQLKRTVRPNEITRCAESGVQELLQGGCTTLIDCTTRPEIFSLLATSPIRHIILWELIALSSEQAETVWQEVLERLSLPRSPNCIALGLNPHAPYSVGPHLRKLLRRFVEENPHTPIGIHVGESLDEKVFFETGTGPFQEFLARHDLDPAFTEVPRCSAGEFLCRENLWEFCHYLYHLNYFTDNDLAAILPFQTVVHCPTTHAYFSRAPFPLDTLLQRGVRVCLGSDSFATADTLNMFEILRMAARMYPQLGGTQLLELVTTLPARGVGLADHNPPLGVIAPGAAADFAILKTAAPPSDDFREILLDPTTCVWATYIGGRKVYELR